MLSTGRLRDVFLTTLLFLTIGPATALAQSTITGFVRDTTGALVPGVTVEASSPALIEQVRIAVTDGRGVYQIVDLRPGLYNVTFTLPGFAVFIREGIVLTANFTAQVNAELSLGTLEETVTVTGVSPIVDLQNVTTSQQFSKELLTALPTSRGFQELAATIPGMRDWRLATGIGMQQGGMMFHGSRRADFAQTYQGHSLGALNCNGGFCSGNIVNPSEVEEYSFQVGAVSIDTETGGPHVDIIPREGGNAFTGTLFGSYTGDTMQGDNTTDELRARGIAEVPPLNQWWDVNGGFGGPIARDKLWFWGTARRFISLEGIPGVFLASDVKAFQFTPDASQPAELHNRNWNVNTRLTYLATPKNKFSFYVQKQKRNYLISVGSTTSYEAGATLTPAPWHYTASWQAPVTNRLLLEASFYRNTHRTLYEPTRSEITPDVWSFVETTTGVRHRAAVNRYQTTVQNFNSMRGTATYVTGSHAFKGGATMMTAIRRANQFNHGDIAARLTNGVPIEVTVYSSPYDLRDNLNAGLALFAEDKWTIERFTVHGALRFDYHNSEVEQITLPAARFVPASARNFAGVSDVPDWTDLSPRFGLAWDVFGTGRTAVKLSFGRYIASERLNTARDNNPQLTVVANARRTWNDANGNFFPDCTLTDPVANGECGALSPSSFGTTRISRVFDDALRTGHNRREFNWETSVAVQHELTPGVAVNGGYFHREFGNFRATDNRAVTPADYDPFCVTAPTDSRLPNGGGYEVCGLYDVSPAKFGQRDNFVTFAENFGDQEEVYDGVDLNVSVRLTEATFQGGINVGRTTNNTCFALDSPQQSELTSLGGLHCDVTPPFQLATAFAGTLNLPYDVRFAATMKSFPGPEHTALLRGVPSSQIFASLGRDLSAGSRGRVNVPLIQPGTEYEDGYVQLDVRVSRVFQLGGGVRFQGNIDVYNALNGSAVQRLSTTFGSSWLRPSFVQAARLLKISGQLDF